jgi:hypothetical protein
MTLEPLGADFGEVICLALTEKAMLVRILDHCRGHGKEIWIPRTAISTRESEVKRRGDSGVLILHHAARWLLKKRFDL